jgi:TetR/AcrR family acrAB operon transcriptional repressor
MVRKTKEDTELTYAALLEAAGQVFFDKGVAQTTLNDIAAAAGMTRGAIYWHFKDKAALLQALFEQATLPMEAMLAELDVCSEADPLGALRQMCIQSLTTLARSQQQQRIFSIMFHKCENIGEAAGVIAENEQACGDECQVRIERILQKAVAMGQLPGDTDVFLSQQVLKNFTMGTMSEWLLDPHLYALDAKAPAMVDLLIAGLRTCPPKISPA